ncbi:MAG: GNAT family N-acetyltransferase [Thermoprotei archaeon]
MVFSADYSIREAIEADKPKILKLVEHTWSWGDYIPSVIDSWLSQVNSKVFVCTYGDEIVGMSHLSVEEGGLGWLEGARVALQHRNKGVATMIANDIIEYASKNGLKKLRLAVAVSNKPSIRHVEKVGFRPVTTFKRLTCETSVKTPLISTKKLGENESCSVLSSNVYESYAKLYYKSFRWLDLNEDSLIRLAITGRAFFVNTTLLIHSSEYEDDGKRIAEIGYLQLDPTTPSLNEVISLFALRLYSKLDLILPEGLESPLEGFVEQDERFIVFERQL